MNNFIWDTKETLKMKIFISWSGNKSLSVAKVLKEWIPCIIQDVQPYVSADDIDKGARWSTDIAKELESASFGILCVTNENLNSQWLNFEAGALSKAIDKSRVCPFLLDLKTTDITDSPILQFQMASSYKEDMLKLFKSINNHLENNGLDELRLEKLFNAFWPEINESLEEIKKSTTKKKQENNDDNQDNNMMIVEMLELLRSQQRLLNSPEQMLPQKYLIDIINQTDIHPIKFGDSLRFKNLIRQIEYEEYKLRDRINELPEDTTPMLTDIINKYFSRLHQYLDILKSLV